MNDRANPTLAARRKGQSKQHSNKTFVLIDFQNWKLKVTAKMDISLYKY